MELQEDELQEIVDAVLSAVRTNSRTIDQLTPTAAPLSDDCIELSGGKRIAYHTLESHLASAVSHTTIPIAEIDTMGYPDLESFWTAMIEGGMHHARYTVTDGEGVMLRNVGILDMFRTLEYCTATQILNTNMLLDNNGLLHGHSDWAAHTYIRHFNINSPHTTSQVSKGQWSPWEEVNKLDEISPMEIDEWFENLPD